MKSVKLSELIRTKVNSLDPSKFLDTKFNLCSISAFDQDKPEELFGKEIGSSKKILIKGDVVISRIVPHIKRIWEIPFENDNMVLGSGEWIVFNSPKIHNGYLRNFLQSELFHKKFMSTVKGVGGSLLRADPKLTGKIEIPLPPLETQKKIAAILDAADEYRQKTKTLIKKYDQLAQSLFMEMFGDPVRNEKGWEKVEMKKICSFKKETVIPERIESGTRYIGLECIEKETGKIIEVFEIQKSEIKSNKFLFDQDYILYGKLRPYLNKVALPGFKGICSTDIIPILPNKEKTNKYFICQIMRDKGFVSYTHGRSTGANLPRIKPSDVETYKVIYPPLLLQNQFAERVQLIEQQKQQAQGSLQRAEELFSSLLQRAFSGELVKE